MKRRDFIKCTIATVAGVISTSVLPALPEEDIIVWGEKTLKQTSFSRLDNRRTVRYIQKVVTQIYGKYIGEINDDITRTSMTYDINKQLDHLLNNNYIDEYMTVIDECNNGLKEIDANNLNVDVYIKFDRTLPYTRLSFNCKRSKL